MKRRNWIFISMIFIVFLTAISVALLGNLFKDKEDTAPAILIEFGTECSKDLDCADSSRACVSGPNATCDNGCIYGVCTRCVPVCPGESECGNMTCTDSVRICEDGRIARCQNYCDIYSGQCTSCIPKCFINLEDDINYQFRSGKHVLDSIPCSNASYVENTEITPVKGKISELAIPDGYDIIIQPFSLNCNGAVDLTLSIPETYADVQALRCRGQECNGLITQYVTDLMCGDALSERYVREEDYLQPKFMPINITEVSKDVVSDSAIVSDQYKVVLKTEDQLGVTLAMPVYNIEEPENPNLKISGTPLILKITGEVDEGVNASVTMPFTHLENFDENSLGMYVKTTSGWKYLGGDIDQKGGTVTADIPNIREYMNKNSEIELALIEVLCVSCYGSLLTQVYEPGGSDTAVVLIHGFAPKPNTFQSLIDDIKLTNQPMDVWTFNYPSTNSINKTIEELMQLLEKNLKSYSQIHVVAHSLGGIIIQGALYDSYMENKKHLESGSPEEYSFVNKVRKVILVATPNEGSPLLDVYTNFFDNFVNKESQPLFNPNSPVMQDLVKGRITPQVPGINYYVIAGTKPYEFNLLLFKLSTQSLGQAYEKNDGIITVKSAQRVGDKYIDDQCKNYWELNLTHTELIEAPIARKVIGQILSEDFSYDVGPYLGHTKYFDLSVADCSSEDQYIIIGKPILKQEVYDETGCSCGNGYCGEGETEITCPSDCSDHSSPVRENYYMWGIVLILSVIISSKIYRRIHHPHIKLIIDHIKNNYEIVPDEGYTHQELKDAFISKGWSEKAVENSLRSLRKEFHKAYHEPLLKHFKIHLKKGYTKEQIKDALIGSGWKEEWLDKVYNGEILQPRFRLKVKPRSELQGHFFIRNN